MTIAQEEIIISADSHTMEVPDFWKTRLPANLQDRAPQFSEFIVKGAQGHQGGWDPRERIKEMAVDGVSAEVLYPTLAMWLFALEDADLQEACFQAYNDWLIEYCQVAPDRLIGVAIISLYNIAKANAELERCAKAGLRGAMIWQTPHPDLPFTSDHYEKFWAQAQELDMPVSQHILTGHGYAKHMEKLSGPELIKKSVNLKQMEAADTMCDIIFSGVLERFPRLKIVMVENEIGWIPFVLTQWDKYFERHRTKYSLPIDKPPTEYFNRQCYATFFNDQVGAHLLPRWGKDNFMWSNDFPHPNSTWPHSRDVIARDLGHLSSEDRANLVRNNVARLYNLKIPGMVQA